MQNLVKDLKKSILDKESKQALSLFLKGLSQNEIHLLREIKAQGVFRCSTYAFEVKILQFLINSVISTQSLSQESISYLESIKSLLFIGRELKKILKILNQEIEKSTFKSYLVSLDALFWPHYFNKKTQFCNMGYSKEEIASAFSFFFFKLNEKKSIDINQLYSVDIRGIRDNIFIRNLSLFYKIVDFREIEVLLDSFGYKAIRKANEVIVKAVDIKLEKSIDLGYLKAELQHEADLVKSRNTFDITDDISLIQIAKKLAVEFKDNFYIEEKPYKRIVMKFPILKVKELISSKQLLYEEKIQMHSIQKELFIDLKKITEIKFYKNICLFDVIKLQRFFTILFFALFEYIETEKLLDSKLFWRSIIPRFDKIYFLKILEDLFGQTKANDLLDLLSWNPNSNKIFDIQYYPILNIDNLIVLPLGILCNSNLTRNVLQSTNYRFDSDDSNDPIGKLLEESLKSVSSLVKRNFSYNYQGKNGEIDIIAIIENQLFIFECKNSLHPTSSFELRTSYESIKKGVKQLNTFQTLWKEEDFKNYISRRINLSIPIQIYRCIVTGNKMFGGWQAEGINVMPIHELINVINTGKISVKEFDLGEQTLEGITFKLWSKDNFNVNDIIDYIENNSLHQCFFLAMEIQKQNIHIGSVNITKNRYMLNMEKFLIEASCRFRLVDNE